MELSDAGAAFIARWEGKRNNLYEDAKGYCTIGIGHLVHYPPKGCDGTEPEEFKRGLTDDEVYALFGADAERFVRAVDDLVEVPLVQEQFDALVSFAFNVGVGGFHRSSVLAAVNAGRLDEVPGQLLLYDKGIVGVRNRRVAEGELFASGRRPMNDWHPRAERVVPNPYRDGGDHVGVPWKLVIHTVEGYRYTPSTASYYGHSGWPHATVVPGRIYQHLPISRAARALVSAPGVPTNRANTVQVEVAWMAGRAAEMPDDLLEALADWLGWAAQETGCPLTVPREFRGPGEGIVLAREDSPIRFSPKDWLQVSGIVGHQHVPVNDHWDPGRLPLDRLNAFLKGGDIVDPTLRQLIVDLHAAMSQEKDGQLPQPKIDALNASIEELKTQVAALSSR